MSYFYLDEMNILDETINFDYPINEINKRHIEKKISGVANSKMHLDKPIKVQGDPIITPRIYHEIVLSNNKPNLNFSGLNPTSFTARRAYLYGLLHDNIANITDQNKAIIGELVIEHQPKTANNQRIFTCYLLENSNKPNNEIDNLVYFIANKEKNIKDLKFDLNKVIFNQEECIHYEHQYDHIMIFTTPISVNSETADYIKSNLAVKTTLFDTSSNTGSTKIILSEKKKKKEISKPDSSENFQNINSSNSFFGFISNLFSGKKLKEGHQDMQDIYIDCQPVGDSDETDVAYTTMVNSDTTENKKNEEFYKMIMNFILFIVIIVVCRVAIPGIYKAAVLQNIVQWRYKEDNKPKRQTYLDFIYKADKNISFILGFFTILYLLTFATGENNDIFKVFFMIFAAISSFGYSLIQLKKKDLEFLQVELPEEVIQLEYKADDEPPKIGFMELLKFPFELLSIAIIQPAYWAVLTIFFFIFVLSIGLNENLTNKGTWHMHAFLLNLFLITPLSFLLYKGSSNNDN
tara:strand:- start:5512 stop:7071 length:1560 start_codon:yes stop_codon:yes gene_type:complete